MSKRFYHIWIIIIIVSAGSICSLEAINLKEAIKPVKTSVEEYSGSSDAAKCAQNSVTKTRCDCRNDTSSSSSVSGVNCAKPSKLSEILSGNNLLDLQPLNISSGASSLITDKQIAVKFDYTAYGIAENGVLFHITQPPKYGTLEVEIWHRPQWQYANAPQLPDNVFTLHDLRTNKVRYTHDGSRHHNDSVSFELEFHSTFYQLPGFLHGMRYTFSFAIIIIPAHEIPGSPTKKSDITSTVAIELTRDTKRVITNDILNVVDYEHNIMSADQIKYQLVNIVNSDQSFFANNKNPDSPITWFTQRDIDYRLIEFAHKTGKHLTDNKAIKVLLKVSNQNNNNNNKTDDRVITLVIKIIERPFALSLSSQSSVQLLQGRNKTKILAKHLSVVSNDSTALQANHIYFTVREAPHHGFISVDDRNNVSTFSQYDIDAASVAYVQVNKASTDYFIVDITASNGDQTLVYDTNVTVVIVTKPLVRFKKPFVNVSAGQRVVITAEYLDASELASITNSTPTFLIISSPKYGYLKNVEHSTKNRKRNINSLRKSAKHRKSLSEFTHEDIIRSRIVYIAEYDTNDRTTSRDSTDPNAITLTDVVKYEISSRGVASALGKLVINIFTADIISAENHYENRYNVTNHLIESSGKKDSNSNDNNKKNNNNGVIDMFPANKKLNVSGYLNIYISSDELLIALVLVLTITVIIALIFITRCCRMCKTAANTQTIKCTANSVDGSEMAMIANRSSPTSVVPPSIVSDIADSVRIDLDNFRTNSVTPTSVTLTTNCSVSNACTPHSIDFGGIGGDQPKLFSSIYPLPPPSLYFTSGSASDIYPTGTAKWPKCSARTCRVTPIVPNCVDGCSHYCTAIHRTLHHQYMSSLAADRASVPVLNKLQHSCSANELYEAANCASPAGSPSIITANRYMDNASNAAHNHCNQCYTGCDVLFNDSCVYPASYHQCIGGDNLITQSSYSTQTYPKPKQQFYV